MGRAVDLFVTYRFLKLLVTPWNKQEAYKQGIIDASIIPCLYASCLFQGVTNNFRNR